MAYVGEVGNKVSAVVTYDRDIKFYSQYAYDGTMHLYVFHDEHDNVIVWKTGTTLSIEKDGYAYFPRYGDTLTVSGKVKEHTLYKETEQTVLIRPKFAIVKEAETYEQRVERIRKAQLDSFKDGDWIYTMPYRQYKDHYADCETLYDSYNDRTRDIDVIVRAGRLVPSGVRFRTYAGYRVEGDKGTATTYRAVSEENAIRRAEKEFPGEHFVCTRIFHYGM